MNTISKNKRDKIVRLRRRGKSIPEIAREIGVSKTTVQRHVLEVTVPERYRAVLREKQGGSKDRATALRSNVSKEATILLGKLSERDYLMLLIGLYWGEGTKRDFEIINSDPFLLQTVIVSLREALKVAPGRLSVMMRVHDDISIGKAKAFWSRTTGIPSNEIRRIEIIKGKKTGKLQHGMCRVRIRSGIRCRLLIQELISLIGKNCARKIR